MPLPLERPLQYVSPPHEALLTGLQEIEWLGRCGEPDTPKTPWGVEALPSWEEAIRRVASAEWSAFRDERHRELVAHVAEKAPDEYGEWGRIERAARSWVDDNVVAILADALPPQVDLTDVASDVERDVLGFVMESIYASVRPPPFHRELIRIYRAGHLPCAWRGRYPVGRLLFF
jgi:hypothetical protein